MCFPFFKSKESRLLSFKEYNFLPWFKKATHWNNINNSFCEEIIHVLRLCGIRAMYFATWDLNAASHEFKHRGNLTFHFICRFIFLTATPHKTSSITSSTADSFISPTGRRRKDTYFSNQGANSACGRNRCILLYVLCFAWAWKFVSHTVRRQ
jgi:hypothetical protein